MTLDLTLYWQSLAPVAARYKIFVHLVGESGPADLMAQADAYPHLPTNSWLPGEYVQDRLHLELPADLSPGSYRLLVGVYEEGPGARLPAYGADGRLLGDSLELESLAVGE